MIIVHKVISLNFKHLHFVALQFLHFLLWPGLGNVLLFSVHSLHRSLIWLSDFKPDKACTMVTRPSINILIIIYVSINVIQKLQTDLFGNRTYSLRLSSQEKQRITRPTGPRIVIQRMYYEYCHTLQSFHYCQNKNLHSFFCQYIYMVNIYI